jgi:hypothetical protein
MGRADWPEIRPLVLNRGGMAMIQAQTDRSETDKKAYERPQLRRRETLSQVTAALPPS